MKTVNALNFLTSIMLITACSSTDKDSRQVVLESWGNSIIVQGYQMFERESDALVDSATSFCDVQEEESLEAVREESLEAVREESLEAVRAAWHETRSSWKRMEVFAFGPYEAYPDRLGPNIDFWPARDDRIEEVLAGDDVLTVESMAPRGATQRGLPVVEYLLYAEQDSSLEAFVAHPRRCDYLVAASRDLNTMALAMVAAWDPAQQGYVKELTEPNADAMYMNSQEAMSEIVNRMAFTIENIRRDKLGKPLGDTATGIAHPESVESLYSGRSIQDIRDSLETIGVLFFGLEETNVRGLTSLPRLKERQDLIDAFQEQFAKAHADLVAIDVALSIAVQEKPGLVERVVDTLRNLQTLIHADVINVLGLSIAFNDTDGD